KIRDCNHLSSANKRDSVDGRLVLGLYAETAVLILWSACQRRLERLGRLLNDLEAPGPGPHRNRIPHPSVDFGHNLVALRDAEFFERAFRIVGGLKLRQGGRSHDRVSNRDPREA